MAGLEEADENHQVQVDFSVPPFCKTQLCSNEPGNRNMQHHLKKKKKKKEFLRSSLWLLLLIGSCCSATCTTLPSARGSEEGCRGVCTFAGPLASRLPLPTSPQLQQHHHETQGTTHAYLARQFSSAAHLKLYMDILWTYVDAWM